MQNKHNAVLEIKSKEMPYPKEDRTPARNNPMPIKELKGFKRLSIKRGDEQNVKIDIALSNLRYWDDVVSTFVHPKGEYIKLVQPLLFQIDFPFTEDVVT